MNSDESSLFLDYPIPFDSYGSRFCAPVLQAQQELSGFPIQFSIATRVANIPLGFSNNMHHAFFHYALRLFLALLPHLL